MEKYVYALIHQSFYINSHGTDTAMPFDNTLLSEDLKIFSSEKKAMQELNLIDKSIENSGLTNGKFTQEFNIIRGKQELINTYMCSSKRIPTSRHIWCLIKMVLK